MGAPLECSSPMPSSPPSHRISIEDDKKGSPPMSGMNSQVGLATVIAAAAAIAVPEKVETEPKKRSFLSRLWPSFGRGRHNSKTTSPFSLSEKSPAPVTRSSSEADISTIERGGVSNPPRGERPSSTLSRIDTIPLDPAPDGGKTAWIQVLMCWLIIMNTWGFVNSFGAFQTHYTSTMLSQFPASTVSWIGSIQAFGVFAFGIISGRAFDMGYFRIVYSLGVFLAVGGLILLSFSSSLWQIFLTHGLINGAGAGLVFVPALSIVSTYFDKKRSMAIGLATTGNSIGGLIYPLVVRQLIDRIGFGWTIRVLALINLLCLGAGIFFCTPRKLRPIEPGPFLDLRPLKDIPFTLYTIGICVASFGSYYVIYYVGSFGRDVLGMSAQDSLNLIMVVNGVGLPARILPGFLADRYFGVFNIYIPAVMACGIISIGWLGVNTVGGLYGWAAMYGLAMAAYQSLYGSIVASLTPRPEEIGTRLGLVSAISALTSVAGGPIGGAIVSASGYRPAMGYAGAAFIFGNVFIIWSRCHKWGWNFDKH